MAHHTEKSIKVNIPAEKVWQVLDDYSGIEKFAMTIKASTSVNEIATGLGAKRKCTFNDGSSLVEEITNYQAGQGYDMDISEHSIPLKSMQASMKVKAIDEYTSEITMSADFVVKGGPFGWLMGQLLMRPVMKAIFKKVMTGLAYHCETGELVADKLPNKDQLTSILAS